MRIIKSSLAMLDIAESANYFAQEDTTIAIKFLEAVEESISLISITPKIGSVKKIQQTELRMWFVKDFKHHLIFYTAHKNKIHIIRVIHSSRDYTKTFKN